MMSVSDFALLTIAFGLMVGVVVIFIVMDENLNYYELDKPKWRCFVRTFWGLCDKK